MASSVFSRIVKPIELTSFNAASLTGSYQAINPNGLDFPCFLIKLENASTANITISTDGVTDHEFLAGTAASIPREILQIALGPSSNGTALFFAKGTIFYVKGAAGSGTIYLSGYYQNGS